MSFLALGHRHVDMLWGPTRAQRGERPGTVQSDHTLRSGGPRSPEPVASRQVFMDRYAAPTRQGGLPAVGPECKVLTAKLLGTVLLSVLHKPWINTRGNSFAVFRF